MSQDFVVSSEADLNAALAQIDVGGASGASATASTITFSGDIALTSELSAINLAAGSRLAIDGAGHTLDGGGQHNGLFVYAGQVSVSNLAINDAVATGGSGGGGGAGLGGGLFVAAGGAVQLGNVTFAHDGAAGGASSLVLNGGGGLDGGSGVIGGGGVGVSATQSSGMAPGPGIVFGAAPGGSNAAGDPGGADGGSGVPDRPNVNPEDYNGGAGGGGGVGGAPGLPGDFGYGITTGDAGSGGHGGFGGGGGGGGSASVAYKGGSGGSGGTGGFGGGGGTGGEGHNGSRGGNGGFGGGGGTDDLSSQDVFITPGGGSAGFGGGTNALQQLPYYTTGVEGGGGGLGAGGAIFVEQGGSLSFTAGSVSGGSVTGGAGAGPNPAVGDGLELGSGIFIQGDEQITLSATAAQTLAISDVIADQTGSTHQTGLSAAGDPLAGAGSVRVEGPGTVALASSDTYSGGTTLAAGTLELLADGAAGSGPIRFAGPAVLAVDGHALASDTPVQGFVAGDGIVLRALRYDATDTVSVSGSFVTVQAGQASYTLDIPGDVPGAGAFTLAAACDGSVLLGAAPPCFAAGTRIATPGGEAAVETLRAGDLVSLASGGAARVRWVGHRRVDLRRHPDPAVARPVRVRGGCLGAGLPRRDLLLSPEHALFLDGVLVPVHVLIDGCAVVQEPWERVTYHHVELERHGVILAEGLPAESYLDTGNRAQFAQGVLASLHPGFGPGGEAASPCAPLALDGPVVEAARARLRAGARPAWRSATISA